MQPEAGQNAPLTPMLLPLAVLLELLSLVTDWQPLSILAGVIFIGYFSLFSLRIRLYSRLLMWVAVTLLVTLVAIGRLNRPGLLEALSAAGFYGAFLGSLGMMQCLVRRFEVLQRIHDVLLGGQSLFLYPKYAVTSVSLGSVLNFGVMSLLCGSISQTLDERGITGESRINWLRCVLISSLRGFSLVPLVAPTSVAVAIITREMPSLSWSQLVPYGLVASLLLIGVGWVLEKRRFRAVSRERMPLGQWPVGTRRLLAVMATVLGLMMLLVNATGLNVSQAGMLAVPSVTLGYMFWHNRGGQRVSRRALLREAGDNVVSMGNEMAIFSGSAALGAGLTILVPPDLIAGIADGRVSVFGLAIGSLLIMPLFSAMGIIPITVLSILGGFLPALAAQGVDILAISVALMIGFSLAMMFSPMGPAVTLLSRFGRLSPITVAFGWNGLFILVSLPLLFAMLWLLSP